MSYPPVFFVLSSTFSTEDNLRAVSAVTGRPIDEASFLADLNVPEPDADNEPLMTIQFDVPAWQKAFGPIAGQTIDILALGYWAGFAGRRTQYEPPLIEQETQA